LQEIKKYNFGFASNGMPFTINFMKINPDILELLYVDRRTSLVKADDVITHALTIMGHGVIVPPHHFAHPSRLRAS
jgi:hypothetical protein